MVLSDENDAPVSIDALLEGRQVTQWDNVSANRVRNRALSGDPV